MKAAMYYSNSDVRIEDVPVPQAGEGELLIRPVSVGICGSDLMEWYRKPQAPLVLGHEIAGIVEESRSPKFKKGDRVCVTHHVPCNTCLHCEKGNHSVCETPREITLEPYDGGMAELVKIPKLNTETATFSLGELSFEEGSQVEPLAACVRSQRMAGLKGDVLILGAGPTGILHSKLASYKGSRIMITDVSDYRLEAARRMGMNAVHAEEDVPAKARELFGKGADTVIITIGALPAIEQALKAVEKGGTIVFFAVPPPEIQVALPMNELWKKEVSLVTTFGAPPEDMKTALGLIGKLSVKETISHSFPLEKAGEAFSMASDKRALKVLINPNKA